MVHLPSALCFYKIHVSVVASFVSSVSNAGVPVEFARPAAYAQPGVACQLALVPSMSFVLRGKVGENRIVTCSSSIPFIAEYPLHKHLG